MPKGITVGYFMIGVGIGTRYVLIGNDWPTHDEWELFDLETDPHEVRNIHDDPAFTDVQRRMHEALRQVRDQYDAPDMNVTAAAG